VNSAYHAPKNHEWWEREERERDEGNNNTLLLSFSRE
jgi:hypothetical protein